MNALGLGGYGSEDEQEDELIAETSADDQQTKPSTSAPTSQAVARQQQSESTGISGEGQALEADVAAPSGRAGTPIGFAASHLELLKTLPPELQVELPGQPPPDVVSKCMKMVALKRDEKRVFNDSLRSHKGYKNPDLLTKLVEHGGVDQYGSAFDKSLFDPQGLPEEDKIGALMQQWERDQERRKVARENIRPEQLRAGQGVEFQRGQGALGVLPSSTAGSTNDLRHQGIVNAAMMRQQAALQAALAVNMAAVKRSKWDAGSAK